MTVADGQFGLDEVLAAAKEAAANTYDVTRDVTEETCIKAVCRACRRGEMPAYRHTDPEHRTNQDERWVHNADAKYHWWHCDAQAIYELRRKRGNS